MTTFNSPLEAFLYWEENKPDLEFLNLNIEGHLETLTYKQSGEQIRKIASYLLSLGLKPKSKIALLSKNCPHWVMADLAIMMTGHVSVPIYPTLHDESIRPILEHSECKLAFIGKLDDFESQRKAFKGIPIVSVEKYGISEKETWEYILNQFDILKEPILLDVKNLITIIYTSGTTGNPKGVMHSIENFTNAFYNMRNSLPLGKHPRFFSYLPLSHIAERIGLEIHCIFHGGTLTFAESLETFAENLEACQPDLFFGVPRIYAKFKEKILENISQNKLNIILSIPFLNRFFKKKLRAKLGLGKTAFIFSGAAPLAVNLMHWYRRIGINILQGYGMTEDCIISHGNQVGHNKIGTVGKLTSGATAKLSEIGEICVKNNCLMLGYYKNKEATDEIFDKDGYLKTGDIGEYDHDGYLSITGRAKDQFKTDKGKYISPAPIELKLLENTDIDQVCIVGMGIPQPIMLVIPSELGKRKTKIELNESLLSSLHSINPGLEKHEKIEKAVVMKEDWSIENGLLTPTLKIKRHQVEKIHRPMYLSWFEQDDRVIHE